MEPFVVLEDIAAPLDRSNVDTDQILPARFLRRPRKGGYQDFLFRDLRFREDGSENPDFVLNQTPFRKARILVGGRNFGRRLKPRTGALGFDRLWHSLRNCGGFR